MSLQIEDQVQGYLRELSDKRALVSLAIFTIAGVTLFLAMTWPKSYTAFSTIYPDNSNILQPLMEGNAVTTGIVDQARLARDILFNREFADPVLQSAGHQVVGLSPLEKNELIQSIQQRTTIENISRNPASLIRIAHTDVDPIRAFSVTQRYVSIFLEQSVIAKQEESRGAFNFIENQVASYQAKLQASEDRLSKFKSENNFGTLVNSNNRIASYRAEMERLELDLAQLDRQIASVESQLAGETEVSRDLTQVNYVRTRINELNVVLDNLRARFHDTYPDVVEIKNSIADLKRMLETGDITVEVIEPNDFNLGGVSSLHQQLRSALAELYTTREATISQHSGIGRLLAAEEERATHINENEAELAELNRDYNVTRDFYNDMLKTMENARVSMHLDEQEQGITFKVQESAEIPTQPDGFALRELMAGSFIFSLLAPIGLLIVFVELDPRVRSESNWSDEWPPLLSTIPPMYAAKKGRLSNRIFASLVFLMLLILYGAVGTAYLLGYL